MAKREQFFYFRKLLPYLVASTFLMSAGIVFGLLSAVHAPGIATQVLGPIAKFAKTLVGLPKLYLALAIFFNNVLKTLLVIVLGTLWGLLPVFFLLLNGYAIGVVLYSSIQSKGMLAFLLAIVPHGLFELPAVLLGTSIGLMLGVHAMKRLFGTLETTITGELRRALRFFSLVIIPLLLLAAFIEAFITSAGVSR